MKTRLVRVKKREWNVKNSVSWMNRYNTIKCTKSDRDPIIIVSYFNLKGKWKLVNFKLHIYNRYSAAFGEISPPVCTYRDALHAYTRSHVCIVCPHRDNNFPETYFEQLWTNYINSVLFYKFLTKKNLFGYFL